MSHHSSNDEAGKHMSEMMREIFGEYPEGKLNVDDEGALAMLLGNEKGKVIIRFPKPVAWVGFTPEQALKIAEDLIYNARQCGSTQPLVITIGKRKS